MDKQRKRSDSSAVPGKYKIGGVNPNDLPLGTYVVRTKVITRGANSGITKTTVFQVKKKTEGNSLIHYWSKISEANLVNGRPKPLSARVLNLVPSTKAQRAYDDGKLVQLHAAFDQNGENATSHFHLRRRKEGDDYVYYWTNAVSKPRARSSPSKKVKKAGRAGKSNAKK